MKTLRSVVETLEESPPEGIIVAALPWSLQSRAEVMIFDDQISAADMTTDGMVYFFEVDLALEFLDGVLLEGDDRCRRLIEYAINDA
jgi:hypothetical protein